MVSWIDRRKDIIGKIIATMKRAESLGVIIDDNKFINEISSEYGCSQRKAKEYLETSRVKLNQLYSELA